MQTQATKTESEFETYCEALASEGYRLSQESRYPGEYRMAVYHHPYDGDLVQVEWDSY